MEAVNCVVIGSGVVGLAIARKLSKSGIQTLVLERNAMIGAETSSRNSEVIHSGLYYPTDSLKAKLCVLGTLCFHHIDFLIEVSEIFRKTDAV